jgi:hypothetical protein
MERIASVCGWSRVVRPAVSEESTHTNRSLARAEDSSSARMARRDVGAILGVTRPMAHVCTIGFTRPARLSSMRSAITIYEVNYESESLIDGL